MFWEIHNHANYFSHLTQEFSEKLKEPGNRYDKLINYFNSLLDFYYTILTKFIPKFRHANIKEVFQYSLNEFSSIIHEMVTLQEQLEEKVAQRTLVLEHSLKSLKEAQAQLVQSEKMVSLGQLTAGIAHEINNPVNYISSGIRSFKRDFNELISLLDKYYALYYSKNVEKSLKEIETFKEEIQIAEIRKEMDDLIRGIEEGAVRSIEIVKGLRNFSRADESELKTANLHDGLDTTLMLLRNQYKNRIEIIKDYQAVPDAECYPGLINQVFMNILSNAVQAIKEKGTIHIHTQSDKEQITISIKDSGVGMSEEVKKRVFELFFTTKDVGVGTGLGLYITYNIISKHQGKIEVLSEEGKGTTFVITIPIHQ